MKKLTTKLYFEFDSGEIDFPEFNVDMKLKSRKRNKYTKIVEHKRKKKIIDSSTKLF
jgi:hypothetical protein